MESIASGAARRIPQKDPPAPLSDQDRHMLEAESGISPEIVAGRGSWTATSRAQLLGLFPKYQRRVPAWVAPMYSPDSVTTSAQLRPRRPGKDKRGKLKKYETPGGAGNILDVHPFMLDKVRDPREPLLITEGVKKADAAASRGRCAIALAGVDSWVNKGGVPVPCWDHVPLEGRRVFVAYDSDVMVKPAVQGALERLVDFLEDQGAEPRMIYLPHHEDGKTGLDDYLAAGGSLAELELAAVPFDREALAEKRLERDEPLRFALAERQRYLREMPVKTIGQNTRAAVVRVITEEAGMSGELVEGGVRVVMDRRTLAEKAAKSKGAVNRAIETLEDEPGALRVDNDGRRPEKAGAFILPIAQKGTQNGGRGAPGGEVGQEGESFSPLSNAPSDRGGYPSALTDDVPALRWPKVILYWEWKGSRRELADYHYVPRLGEKRGQIIRHVLEEGGSSSVEDLMGRFAGERTRPWDFRRRTLGPLVKAGILDETAEGVALTDDWREALERERERANELEDARKQRQRHADQRRKYRQRDKTQADEEPELRGKERNREALEHHRERWKRERVEAERQKAGTTAAVFLVDDLAGLSGVRWQELRERWITRGGRSEDLRRAVQEPLSPFRFDREEADGGELYVYAGAESRKQPHASAAVVLLRPEVNVATQKKEGPDERRTEPRAGENIYSPPKKEPHKMNGVHIHGPECACWLCEDEPSYAGALT